MANSEYDYTPTYIRRIINNRPKDVVTAKYWNELFNLLIAQGDHTAEELGNILNYFSTRLIGVENEIAESAEAIANIREVFRINVTSSVGGVYSADKTFYEIKAAYDAGQLPYVVDDALSGFYDIYTLSHFWYDESSTQGFVDFERYIILENTLKTDTLRIHSHALASGSNIERRISAFNVPSGTTYVKVSSAGGVISTVNGETYADIQALINDSKPVVVRYGDVLDFYYFETSSFSGSSGIHKRLSFRCDMGDSVYTLTLRDDNTWAFSENSLQSESITDKGGYFTTDTVEGALQEIGAGLAGAYSKPSSGIPKTDLAEAVQTSLGKADTALQEHQSLAAYRKAAAQDAIDAQKQSIITDLETIRSGAAKGATALQSVPTTYRTAAEQDAIDNTKLTDAPADGKEYARKNGNWQEVVGGGKVSSVNGKTGVVTLNAEDIIYAKESQKLDVTIASLKAADAQMASDISNLQTADASLDSRITVIETGDTPVTLYIYWESVVGTGRVSLTENGTAVSVADFISKMQSGAKIIIGKNNDGDSESQGFSNYRYKITDSATASLAFDVANSFNGSNRTIIISGSSSTNGLMTGYQDIGHDDLPDYSPLPEGSTPASKAWVEDYVDTKLADGIIIPSSTVGSTKRFKLTVDDSGAITATEVTT